MNKRIVGGVVVLVLVVGLGGVWAMNRSQSAKQGAALTSSTAPTATGSQSTTSAVPAHTFSYKGEDGKTALELLKQHDPTAQTKGEGTNAFVTSIGGYAADDVKHEYWEMLVNGKSSTVGAGSYTTKSTDMIEWRIATY